MYRKLVALTPVLVAMALLIAPTAAQARGCSVDDSPRAYGPTYTTKLRVAGVSCSDGKGLLRNWDECRRDNGGSDGRCKRPGFRFRCSENRSNVIRTQYDSRVTCKRGGDRVIFRYTQFT